MNASATPGAEIRPATTTPPADQGPTKASPDFVQVRLRPDSSWLDYEASLAAFWEELPKLILAGIGGWFVAVRLTNRWDLAKKRNEFDIRLAQDFYDAIGKFKAVGRQAEVFASLPNPLTINEQKERDAARDRILGEAIELESRVDAMLAKVILEDRSARDIDSCRKARRLHVAGLVRAMVRNLREGIQHNNIESPTFGTPEFYLSSLSFATWARCYIRAR